MTLPTSGPISLSAVNTELSLSATALVSLNDADVRTLANVASGTISLNSLYGKSTAFNFSIADGLYTANLRTLALAAGWNQSIAVVATLPSTRVIRGNTALTIDGSWPGGVTFVNQGTVYGEGGGGGSGGAAGVSSASNGSPGGNGGRALLVSVAVTIDNAAGAIYGGGGGGGGGASISAYGTYGFGSNAFTSYSAGGGAGGGQYGASAGSAGQLTGSTLGGSSTPASSGSGVNGGAGGNAYIPSNTRDLTSVVGGSGGTGGGAATAGTSGNAASQSGSSSYVQSSPGAGGAPGACLAGNSLITWTAFGTRAGAIT